MSGPLPTPTQPCLPQINEPDSPPPPHFRNSIRAYAIEDPSIGIAQDVLDPRRASIVSQHVDSQDYQEFQWRPTLLSVGPRFGAAGTLSEQGSFVSSGLSVTEVSVPEVALDAVHLRYPATYRCVVTNHAPATPTSDSDGASVEKTLITYAIEPLAGAAQIATKEKLEALQLEKPLPPLPTKRRWLQIKYLCFTCYLRLMIIALLANIITIATLIGRVAMDPKAFSYNGAAMAVGINLLVAMLMRHEHFVNLLFTLACSLPLSAPLQLRRNAAKLTYNTGGIHAGCANSALLWYIFFLVLLICQFDGTPAEGEAIAAIAAGTVVVFVTLAIMAHPTLRRKYHDQWELSHRYGGWTAIALIWAQTIIIVVSTARKTGHSVGLTLLTNATFWFLLLITGFLVHPWLYLRRRTFTAEPLSSHATRLWFKQNKFQPTCIGTRLSHAPLVENHGFATIPNANGEKGYSIIVSNAGDWTKKMITNPPKHVWMRGAPTYGVMRISSLFKPIIVVATGSGIGPCLSYLQARPDHPMRVIWSARFPEATFGKGMMDAVLRADKHALVIDTKKTGHPNLPALAYALYKQSGAEAVIVISNPKVTRDVVYEMESRKIPAFGAVFDS